MKILFISHDASRTGAPILLLNLISWLREHRAVRPTILLRTGGVLENDFKALGPVFYGAEIEQFVLDRREGKSFDLIYCNTAVPGDILEHLKTLEVPVLTHVHELEIGIRRWAQGPLIEGILKNSNKIIAVSMAVQKNLTENMGYPEEKTVIINGCVENKFLKRLDSMRSKESVARILGIADDPSTKLVCACGTSDWRKGPDLFLYGAFEVFKRRSIGENIHFIWVGNSHSGIAIEQLKYEVEKLHLKGKVHFIGKTESPELFLSAADLFWLTSREDPFPLVCLEAAAQQVPTICFDGAGGMPEFVSQGNGVVVPFGDFNELSSVTLELLSDDRRRTQLGIHARDAVLSRHTIDYMGGLVYEEIRAMIGGREGVFL